MSEETKKDEESDGLGAMGAKALLRLPLAVTIGSIVVFVGAILSLLGFGDKVNIGGILGKLIGKGRSGKDPIDIANLVPDDRTDEEGNPVEKGEEGPEGFVQRKVDVIDPPSGIFRDKSVVRVKSSEGYDKVKLPEGVKDSDVREVYEVEPGNFRVVVEAAPDSGITDEDLEILKEKLK